MRPDDTQKVCGIGPFGWALIVTLVIAAFVLLPRTARAQDHEHYANRGGNHGPHGHDQLHYWYQTLKQPGTGMSCCNNQDCRPTTARMKGAEIQVEVDGEWTTVPPNKILNVSPPDLNAHVCAPKSSGLYPKGYVFCVVLGSGV